MAAATILCADDDRGFCQILSRAFTQAGYRVETAHDGVAAVERARALKPALMTLDVMLPRLDGFRVLEAIRGDKGLANTPALFVSGCTFTPDYQARARSLAAAAVLKKPVPLDAGCGIGMDIAELARVVVADARTRDAAREAGALERGPQLARSERHPGADQKVGLPGVGLREATQRDRDPRRSEVVGAAEREVGERAVGRRRRN